MAEGMLGKIAHSLGVKEDTNVGDDEEDRKRLKVRLKEALESKRPVIDSTVLEAKGFLERYFGICGPDGRTGKHGSRSVRSPDRRPFPDEGRAWVYLLGSQAHPPAVKIHARLRSGAESALVAVCILCFRSNARVYCAAMLVANAFFLVYTTILVPVQICLWNYDDPCNKFPTLYFDVIVDAFFMVDFE
jgi:hypothetical protein